VESEQASFRVVEITDDLRHPWAMAFLPDGDILVTERHGRLRRIHDGRLERDSLDGVPKVFARGQGGLMDVVLHPEFAENRWLYLSYSSGRGNAVRTSVMRARLGPNGLEEQTVLFETSPPGRRDKHFGSRLAFGADGLLYITVGERGERRRAQELNDHNGSVLRLNSDGSVPADNPYVGNAEAKPEIYSHGHRNPQGLAVQPGTGLIFAHEHGPRGGDELNLIQPGVNYGWPIISHGREYTGGKVGVGSSKEGLAQPLWVWTPSIAPSGMSFYQGGAFPGWQGDLLVGALKYELIVRLEIEDGRIIGEERLLERRLGRIRDVRAGPDGLVYVLTDERSGGMYRLEPAER
jgi:glucose/arabinose dehydrogenase